VQKVPEVALDDCLGSVRATLAFVYNDHTQQFGWGKEGPERLEFTWKAVADSQELKPDWDYKQAIDTSLVEK
jgi:NitT/TauT family transport system substrate-binding protein